MSSAPAFRKTTSERYWNISNPSSAPARSLPRARGESGLPALSSLLTAGRPARVTPIYDVLKDQGAEFGVVKGHVYFTHRLLRGIEALRQYRSDWDDKRGVLRLQPLHDWSSHSADSMRYFATGENLINTAWGDIDYSAMDGRAYA